MLIAETALVPSMHCIFFLVEEIYQVNYCDLVSNLQVEIYHMQLQIKSLLLFKELQDRTQKATQGTRRQSRLACMGFGLMPHRNVWEGIDISISRKISNVRRTFVGN